MKKLLVTWNVIWFAFAAVFLFGERDRLRRALESAGFSNVHEEDRVIRGPWAGSVEEYWEQFTEVAAP